MKLILKALLITLTFSSQAYTFKRSELVGTHHSQPPFYKNLVKLCFKNPKCLGRPDIIFLGLVSKMESHQFSIYFDRNLIKKELGLLDDGIYRPERQLLGSGEWDIQDNMITFIRETSEETQKSSYRIESLNRTQAVLVSIDGDNQGPLTLVRMEK